MSDSPSWSLQVGRWRRMQVRVHALFFAMAVLVMYLCVVRDGETAAPLGAMAVAILLVSGLLHELGHCCGAWRLGGSADRIVIGPLSGSSHIEIPREPQPELIAALAGQLVNVAILLLSLPILLAADVGLADLLSPLQPRRVFDGVWWIVALKLTFWSNWLMLVVNLLPAFPFDGARALRCVLWPALDYRGATLVVARTSKLTALGLCILAWLLGNGRPDDLLPAWVPLSLLAVWIFFSAQHETTRLDESEWDEGLFNYDFSQGYTSLERTIDPPRKPGSTLRRWIENRRELRRRRRRSQEQEEERQVDEILLRLHEAGMDGLTAKERALLHRVSARYRNRQQS